MQNCSQIEMLVLLCSIILTGCAIGTCAPLSSYDYSASIDCLPEPLAPQYGGGQVENPNFDSGLAPWAVFGNGKIDVRTSKTGNKFLAAFDRKMANDSFSYMVELQKDILYTFSAWLQVNAGKEIVSAYVKIPKQPNLIAGSVIATSGCWSMLKGGFIVGKTTAVQLYFKSNNSKAEIWMDNVSLKGFTNSEWQEHQNKIINEVRKRSIRVHVTNKGKSLQGTNITLTQTRRDFVIGCGSSEKILEDPAYQAWFVSRFQATTFGNEMKWYYTETRSLRENYDVPDAMVSFFEKNQIAVRGHNILWDNKNNTPSWVQNFQPRLLLKASVRHIGSVVSRYAGRLIAWDVMNENIHYSFYEDILGPDASAKFYQIVGALDTNTPLFLNDYNTLELPNDLAAIPSRYIERIRSIQSFPGNDKIDLRIGLQGHFLQRPNVSYIRAVLDVLGATGIPIWITELDTKRGPNQAAELEAVMREVFSHPAVEGIIVWGQWKPTGCKETCLTDKNYDVLPKGCAQMCLVDNNFNSLPPGVVVDKLLEEWRIQNLTGVTDKDGVFEQTVFHGEYSITFAHPMISGPAEKIVYVAKGEGALEVRVDL